MSLPIQGLISSKVKHAKSQLLEVSGLDFLNSLDINSLLKEKGIVIRERIFSPVVTLWVFLSQVFSQDHSCKEAVYKLIALMITRGKGVCSSSTGGYCRARKRLSESFISRLALMTGEQSLARSQANWLWKGRIVKVVDGCTVRMSDTEANQREYPQTYCENPGCGFPIARVLGIFSLATGALVDLAIGPYKGKDSGENYLFRTLYHGLSEGEIVVGDSYYGNFWTVFFLMQMGVDVVFRVCEKHIKRRFKRTKIGKNDWLCQVRKPTIPIWLGEQGYHLIDDEITLRLTKIHVPIKGFRTQSYYILSSLFDDMEYSTNDLADLYFHRWEVELYIRSIKKTMNMHFLRGKTPELVRKEIWIHMLGYNIIRLIMANAATQTGLLPRMLSFKSALQIINIFEMLIITNNRNDEKITYENILAALSLSRVGNREGRSEPRAYKVRPYSLKYPRLKQPRQFAKTAFYRSLQRNKKGYCATMIHRDIK